MYDDGWKKHYTKRVVCMNNECHIDLCSTIQAGLVQEFEDAGYLPWQIPYCPFCGKRMEEFQPQGEEE
jgi:hypothetical protein